MDIETFREHFPEFTSATIYPDALIGFWSAFAELSVSSDNAGDLYVPLVELATAHHITTAANDAVSASSGASPGSGGGGVIGSKTIGSITVSYDHSKAMNANADDWNMTSYGRRYWRLMRMLGAGPVFA